MQPPGMMIHGAGCTGVVWNTFNRTPGAAAIASEVAAWIVDRDAT
jgi:hypothetical protein